MKLPLAYYGSPSLRRKARKVEVINDEVRQLVNDMLDTMREHRGMGLAATQVHKDLAIFLTDVPIFGPDNKWHPGVERVYINPKILSVSLEQFTWDDGCLSIPGLFCSLSRPARIRIRAQNLEGEEFEEELVGLFAFNFLHENDHLNGVLYIDRLNRQKRKEIEPVLARIKKEHARP